MIKTNPIPWTFIVVAALVMTVWLVAWFEQHGTVKIVNRSKLAIESGELTACRQSFDIGKIAPGQSSVITYLIRGDSDYQWNIKLSNGKLLSGTDGYITSGMPEDDELIVTDEKVELKMVR